MVLNQRQQAQIAKTIREKNPDQLHLPGFLWTREAVGELIEQRCCRTRQMMMESTLTVRMVS